MPQPLNLRIQRAEVVDAPAGCCFQAGSCARGCSLALPRQWFDWEGRGEDNDFLSTTGFLWALRDTLRLRRGGLLWGGLPCCRSLESNMDGQWNMLSDIYIYFCKDVVESCCCPEHSEPSWVWVSSGTHGRYISILGDQRTLFAQRPRGSLTSVKLYMVYMFPMPMPQGTSFVRAGNCIATRFCMLAVLALVLGCNYAATWHRETRKLISKITGVVGLQTKYLRWNNRHHPHLSIGLISSSWLACTKQHSSVCFLTKLGNTL